MAPLPAGATVTVAVKSINASNELSGISDTATVYGPGITTIILRSGQPMTGGAIYNGVEAASLDAAKPAEPGPNPPFLPALASVDKPKMFLLRFKGLPNVPSLQKAVLRLTTRLQPRCKERPRSLAGRCAA